MGGCFSDYADYNGTIQLKENDRYSTKIYALSAIEPNSATFSFKAFGFPRKMYIQAQVKISLSVGGFGRRLLQTGESDIQARHFIASAIVGEKSADTERTNIVEVLNFSKFMESSQTSSSLLLEYSNAEGSSHLEVINYLTSALAFFIAFCGFQH